MMCSLQSSRWPSARSPSTKSTERKNTGEYKQNLKIQGRQGEKSDALPPCDQLVANGTEIVREQEEAMAEKADDEVVEVKCIPKSKMDFDEEGALKEYENL